MKYHLAIMISAIIFFSMPDRSIDAALSNNNPKSGPIEQKISSANYIIFPAPFTVQAPFGKWSDMRQQDGCEEASSLMAIKWARNEKLSSKEALTTIIKSSDYIQKKFGEYRDISTADTIKWIINDYFRYRKAIRKTNVTLEDIVAELRNNRVIIAPMNGQLLHNPYYTPPGPVHHMLLIIGHDESRKVFITNDPGTRRGASYKYPEKVLFNAIADYPTGFNLTAPSMQKNIISVWK